jgi:hypothetical protein
MYSIIRPVLIVAALVGLSCGVAVAQTTVRVNAVGASAAHNVHVATIVRCKNPAECSVPR